MGRLMMLAENYPQLRSDGPMIEAQRTYSEIETNIAAARRFYNASVGSLTNAVATFPGPLLKGLAGSEMEPVQLEHQEFEERYDVHSTDQVEARALLTPAFMERFVALASKSHFALPGAIADGNRFVVAMPKRFGMHDLFEPPAYWQPSDGRALSALQGDIRTVLDFAETIMRLDFWAQGRLADAQRSVRQAT